MSNDEYQWKPTDNSIIAVETISSGDLVNITGRTESEVNPEGTLLSSTIQVKSTDYIYHAAIDTEGGAAQSLTTTSGQTVVVNPNFDDNGNLITIDTLLVDQNGGIEVRELDGSEIEKYNQTDSSTDFGAFNESSIDSENVMNGGAGHGGSGMIVILTNSD